MNLGCQLITHKRITTTLAKAKALRVYIEPLITKTKNTSSKEAIMHNHRIVFSYLNDKLAVKELERSVKQLGLPGIEIGSNVNQLNLNEPQFFEIFKAAEELNACVFIHPWEMMGKDQMQRYWLPWLVGMPAQTSRAICSMIFGGIFEKLPKLRVAFAHGGGSFPATFGRIAHGFDERPDLVAVDNPSHPKNYLGKFWLDSLTHDEKMLRYIMDFAGDDKICLGSDYPFPLGELQPGKLIEEADLKKKVKRKLLWRNAFEWLGLNEKLFDKK
jgi:aminocarboxymuconate-semialdehyde decarboxylase